MKTTAFRFLLPLAFWFSFVRGFAQQPVHKGYAIWGNPEVGRHVYAEKGCGKCHAIAGIGPTIGPDLGKPPETPQTITQIAGAMWNHAPQMRRVAQEKGVGWESFEESEMRDLIAFLYFLRVQDQPGNVARGRRLFDQKHCSGCHALAGTGGKAAADLTQWKQHGSPILWAEVMWRHAIQMETKMRELGLAWPRLEGSDMIDLIAFIQSEAQGKPASRPGQR
ncbi:MAG: c-type cytochrome [Thermoanaerobaculia bacterium]